MQWLTLAQTRGSSITSQKDAFCRGGGTRRVSQQHERQPGREDIAHAVKGRSSSLPVHPPPKKRSPGISVCLSLMYFVIVKIITDQGQKLLVQFCTP